MMTGTIVQLGSATAGQVLYQGPPTSDDLSRYNRALATGGPWGTPALNQGDAQGMMIARAQVKAGTWPYRTESGGDGVALIFRYNSATKTVTIKAEADNNLIGTITGWLRKACSVGQYADPRIAAGCALVGQGGGAGGESGIVSYPTDAITAQNPMTGLWHIAVPKSSPLSGLGLGPAQIAAYKEIEQTPVEPRGPAKVSWEDYQKAAPPWYKRPVVWLGIAAGVGVIGGGAWYLRRKRRK